MNKITHKNLETAKIIEAIVFASKDPVNKKDLEKFFDNEKDYQSIIDIINSRYNEFSGVEFFITKETLSFRTKPEIAGKINLERKLKKQLSRASTEVLSIIAYHQPITRAEIEEIRGVSLSKGVLDILLESNWIKPHGRRRTPGRPITWGTTNEFLDYFGLKSIVDLPSYDELKKSGILQKKSFSKISDDINEIVDEFDIINDEDLTNNKKDSFLEND